MTLVETLLLSAAVSAFVTLTIEYLAKPRLEARKERILARHRDRWQLERDLRQLHRLGLRQIAMGTGEYAEYAESRFASNASRLIELGDKISDEDAWVMGVIDERIHQAAGIIMGLGLAIQQQATLPRHSWDEFQNACDDVDCIVQLLDAPAYSLRRKYKLAKTLGILPILAQRLW